MVSRACNIDGPGLINQHNYVPQTLSSLWSNLPLVVLVGLFFSLLCAPSLLLLTLGLWGPAIVVGAFTIAPGWTALLAQEVDIAQSVRPSGSVMLRALPRYWFRAATLGLLVAVPLLAALATLPGLAHAGTSRVVWLGLAGDVVGIVMLSGFYLYSFPLLVMRDMAVGTALRNGLVLAGRHPANTVGLLSMVVLSALAVAYISSGLMFFLPATLGLFIVNNCRLVVAEEQARGLPGH